MALLAVTEPKQEGTPYTCIEEVRDDVLEQWKAMLTHKKHPVAWFSDELSPDQVLMNFAKNAVGQLEKVRPKFQDKILAKIDKDSRQESSNLLCVDIQQTIFQQHTHLHCLITYALRKWYTLNNVVRSRTKP